MPPLDWEPRTTPRSPGVPSRATGVTSSGPLGTLAKVADGGMQSGRGMPPGGGVAVTEAVAPRVADAPGSDLGP